MRAHVLLIGAPALFLVAQAHVLGNNLPARPASVDAAFLKRQGVAYPGNLTRAFRIIDQGGKHLLVLSRRAGPSIATTDRTRIEHIELAATYLTRAANSWKRAWIIRDGTDCPELDPEGDFFANDIHFTDLNRDGRVEVTVAYHLFCGGGVDPRAVKVILRDGSTKLAIRGESELRFPGQPSIGGEHKHDKALFDPTNAAFKRHLDAVWGKVSIERRP